MRSGKASQSLVKRKSGDPPEAIRLDSASLGKLKSILADLTDGLPERCLNFFPALLHGFVHGRGADNAGDAPGFGDTRAGWCAQRQEPLRAAACRAVAPCGFCG